MPSHLGPKKPDVQSRKQPRRALIHSHVWTPASPCWLKVWVISADLRIKVMCTNPGEHLNTLRKKPAPSPCMLYYMKFSFLTKLINSNHHLFSFWQELSRHRITWLIGKKETTLYLSYWTCAAIKSYMAKGENKIWKPCQCPAVGYCPPSLVILPDIYQPTNSFGQIIHSRHDLVAAELFRQTKAKTPRLIDWTNVLLIQH